MTIWWVYWNYRIQAFDFSRAQTYRPGEHYPCWNVVSYEVEEGPVTRLTEAELNSLRTQLKTARGKGYFDLLKRILAEIGPQIAADAEAAKPLTAAKIGALALRHDLNFKATCEWLEESRVIHTGNYDNIAASLKVRDILAGAQERYGEKGERLLDRQQ